MTQQAKMYPGPDGTFYNVKDTREMQAWEDAWADHMGQQRTTVEAVVDAARPAAQTINPEAKKQRDEAVAYIRDYRGAREFIVDLSAPMTARTVSGTRGAGGHSTLAPRPVAT